jgi:DNA adenine methylase
MRYLGGKARAGKYIAAFLNEALRGRRRFIEPFVGGFNIVPHIKTTGVIQCADANRALINLFIALSDGWKPPKNVTRDEYELARNLSDENPLKAFCATCCSFGGKWFGGYAKGEGSRNYALNGFNSLERKRTHARRVSDFYAGDYAFLFTGAEDAVIYCDPPYRGAARYSACRDFDSGRFWSWCQEMAVNNDVFVSEYACPVSHELLWEKEQKTTCTTSEYKTATERLFKVLPRADGPEPRKPEPQKPEPQKPEPQKPEPQKPEPQKPEPQKPKFEIDPSCPTDHIAIDFETYYDDDCSVSRLGPHNYTRHSEFTAYLVAIYAEDFRYCGDLAGAPWDRLDGSRTLVAHNSTFEIEVVRWGKRTGVIPDHVSEHIEDTAAVCRYLNVAGTLSGAMKGLYGEERSKAIRDKDMKGKLPRTMSPELWEGVKAYGLQDAEDCWRIWHDFSHVNMPLLAQYIDHLATCYHECITEMPWVEEGEKPGSAKAVRELCRKLGIAIPASFNKKMPDVKQWVTDNSDHPWVNAFMDHKSINGFRQKLLNMQNRIDNGVLYYDMIYGGTRTLRWAGRGGEEGGSGYNILNLRKEEMFGCYERHLLIPPPGKRFAIRDYAQIEPRIVFCLVGKENILEMIRQGMSVYEAYARANSLWSGSENLKAADPKKYGDIKSDVLGLGYGMGKARYQDKIEEDTGVRLPLQDVAARINRYRYQDNPEIPALWKLRERQMKAYRGAKVFQQPLKSGRPIYYYDVVIDSEKGNIVVPKELGFPRRDWYWGGKLVENEVQATARDVLRDNALLATEKAGIDCRLHVYDEGVFCIDQGSAKAEAAQAEEIGQVMAKPLDWFPELPLATDLQICDHYTK